MGDAARAAMLATADCALRFHMEEAGVSAAVQQKIYSQGFCTLECFANLEESKSALRGVFAKDFGVDCSSDLTIRKKIALLLCVGTGSDPTQLSGTKQARCKTGIPAQGRATQLEVIEGCRRRGPSCCATINCKVSNFLTAEQSDCNRATTPISKGLHLRKRKP